MGKIKRYRTAWSRHHRSRGFGIHSPFAFNFVRRVLRERLPYYSYEHIEELRKTVIKCAGGRWRRPRVISLKNAKMLFRIVNFFNPQSMLQVGTTYGVSSACMLEVSSTSHLHLYEPQLDEFPIARQIVDTYGQAITLHSNLSQALDSYSQSLGNDDTPFILINNLPSQDEYIKVLNYVKEYTARRAVVVMRNISSNALMKQLWLACKDATPHGQTYTNEKLGLIVATPKLQREDFFLWF